METSRSKTSLSQRLAYLGYGTAAYLIFFATFLYLMAFVLDLWAPSSVNRGAEAPLGAALLVDSALIGLFALQHLIMARLAFKRWWTRIVSPAAERSTFVLATCAVLWLLMLAWRPIGGTIWAVESQPWFAVLRAGGVFGWGIVLFSSFLIDHFDLFGLRQAVLAFLGRPYRAPQFKERSLYRHVRHPLYLGMVLAFWCTPVMTVGHLVFAALFTTFILVGIRFEENTLQAVHGQDYADYRRRVPMLLPTPWRLRRASGLDHSSKAVEA